MAWIFYWPFSGTLTYHVRPGLRLWCLDICATFYRRPLRPLRPLHGPGPGPKPFTICNYYMMRIISQYFLVRWTMITGLTYRFCIAQHNAVTYKGATGPPPRGGGLGWSIWLLTRTSVDTMTLPGAQVLNLHLWPRHKAGLRTGQWNDVSGKSRQCGRRGGRTEGQRSKVRTDELTFG